MSAFRAVPIILALSAIPSTASAKLVGPLEVEAVAGLGGPLFLIGASYPGGVTTKPFTGFVAGRLGFPDYSLLRLEVSAVIPSGFGVNLLLDVLQIQRVRLHLIDPGVFWNVGDPVSASRIHRKMDFTLGAGCDVRVWGNWSAGLNWRWFVPNPITVIPTYDGFSYPAYREALRGGQLWLSASYTW